MAKILLGDRDALFATAFEDHLHVAGHQVVVETNVGRIVRSAAEHQADLVVLSLVLPSLAGVEAVRALRRLPEIRSLPILVLSEGGGNNGRVSILRAGADDLVTKTCGLEEVLLRVERLLGNREAGLRLQGDFEDQPPWEMVQCVQQVAKSGELVVRSRTGSGKIRIEDGAVTAAQWGRQQDQEALLAILGLKEGRFQFLADPRSRLAAPQEEERPVRTPLPVQQLLMEAAWLEDELEKRRSLLPATGVGLMANDDATPKVPVDMEDLPVEWVWRRLQERPGLRLFDLMAQAEVAPTKVRLAVALLIEQKALQALTRTAEKPLLSTTEITSAQLFDVVVTELHEALFQAGFMDPSLSLVLLAEPSLWPALTELFDKAPAANREGNLQALLEKMPRKAGGSAVFDTKLGQLVLHVQPLTPAGEAEVDGVIGRSCGVLVWVDEMPQSALVRTVVRRLAEARPGTSGVLMASREAVRGKLGDIVRNADRWYVSPHPPQSLLGIFRLYHPRKPR